MTNGTICLPTRQVLAIVPFVTRRRLSSGLVWPGLSRGVFPKLSKTAQSRGRLGAPAYAAPVLRTGVIRHFEVTFIVCFTQVIRPAGADVSLAVGGSARAERTVQAKQNHRGKTAPTSESYFHSSTVFGRHQEGKRISLVTMAGAFCTMVQRSVRRCGRFTFDGWRQFATGSVSLTCGACVRRPGRLTPFPRFCVHPGLLRRDHRTPGGLPLLGGCSASRICQKTKRSNLNETEVSSCIWRRSTSRQPRPRVTSRPC